VGECSFLKQRCNGAEAFPELRPLLGECLDNEEACGEGALMPNVFSVASPIRMADGRFVVAPRVLRVGFLPPSFLPS
jgi:DNA-binding IclR family transcriptional regulator